VDAVADSADEQARPFGIHSDEDGLDAETEQERAQRVALLLAGAGFEDADLAVLAPDEQVGLV
jgi:hypothetical protein